MGYSSSGEVSIKNRQNYIDNAFIDVVDTIHRVFVVVTNHGQLSLAYRYKYNYM